MITPSVQGHVAATTTILIWGTTFIATKVLLKDFLPVEILTLRFLIGLACLLILNPHLLPYAGWSRELLMAAAGCCGIFLYYLLENIALSYTLAAHVGVIMCLSPLFTALFEQGQGRRKPEHCIRFLLGFAISITGVCLISFSSGHFRLHGFGDLLALLAAAVWGIYSLLMQHIGRLGYSPLLTTQRTFSYGLAMMFPLFLYQSHLLSLLPRLQSPGDMVNLFFLGVGASAICFVSWNFAIKTLGALYTSVYIYLVPVVTVITAILILDESLSLTGFLGCFLPPLGVLLTNTHLQRWRHSKK